MIALWRGTRFRIRVRQWMRRPLLLVYIRLVLPFLQSSAPLPQVAWGASVGTFVALTPTMGVQMWIVTILWVVSRYLLRLRFNLPVAMSLVWISNPVTFIPLYYLFLVTGDWALRLQGVATLPVGFAGFRDALQALERGAELSFLEKLWEGLVLLIMEFGWPLLVGSLLWASAMAAASYPFTVFVLRRYREFLARQQGITYDEWRRRNVR